MVFDFDKSPSFYRKWNKEFDVEDINSNCFYIVIVDDICEDNINDCINNDGQLLYSESSHVLKEECSLMYSETSNGDNADIRLNGTVTFNLSSDFSLKGIFIVNDSGYVLGSSINTYSLNVSDALTLEDGLYFWSLVEGVING